MRATVTLTIVKKYEAYAKAMGVRHSQEALDTREKTCRVGVIGHVVHEHTQSSKAHCRGCRQLRFHFAVQVPVNKRWSHPQ